MNISRTLIAGAAVLALALPLAVSAQTTTAPAPAADGTHAHHGGGLNRHAMQGIKLSDDQQQQLLQLRTDYRKAHPKGSTPDPASRKALRDQMLNILTPDQQTQYQANIKQAREEHKHQTNPGGPFASPSPAPAR
jgi:Spy/CpxP family protein refolding chaperone